MSEDALAEIIRCLGPDRVKVGEPLALHTTYRIGGPADLFYEARTTTELVNAVGLARSTRVPYLVLGLGANILVGDKGVRGLVIKNSSKAIRFVGPRQITADSGATIADLIVLTAERGLSGLEHFVGIPSTVGGALWQNLHFLAPDRKQMLYIEHVLAKATVLREEGDIVEVDRDYFRFGYDDSILHYRQDVVLSATFNLTPVDRNAIQAVIAANLQWRQEKHPDLNLFPSAGSVFRRIESLGAGRLIDQCGLKGYTIGKAQISPKHANFIVNLGGATASDVLQLIQLCKDKVRERFSVELQEEIRLVGEF